MVLADLELQNWVNALGFAGKIPLVRTMVFERLQHLERPINRRERHFEHASSWPPNIYS